MPALRSGTKDVPWAGLAPGPWYPMSRQLIQSHQLSASSTPSTSCSACSGVTLTAKVFGSPGADPRRDVEIVGDVHADDAVVVGQQLAVEPDLGAIVDPGELQRVVRVPGRRGERRAVPPVLSVEIRRDVVAQIGADVEIGIDAVVLQGLQDGRGHPPDRVPAGVVVAALPTASAPVAGTSRADASFQPWASSTVAGAASRRANDGKSPAPRTSTATQQCDEEERGSPRRGTPIHYEIRPDPVDSPGGRRY